MLDELNISNAVWKRNKTKDFYQVYFKQLISILRDKPD